MICWAREDEALDVVGVLFLDVFIIERDVVYGEFLFEAREEARFFGGFCTWLNFAFGVVIVLAHPVGTLGLYIQVWSYLSFSIIAQAYTSNLS